MSRTEHPPVTVALPVHNGARFVAEAVTSVLEQSGWDIHLIAVDDGSTDDSVEILGTLAAQDARLVLVGHPRNLGVAAARNRAISLRNDPLIAFIDQDDRWTSHHLDHAWQALRDDPTLDFVLAHQRFFQSDAELPAWFRPRWLEAPQPAYLLGAMLAWRARAWDEMGQLDETLRMGDDIDWFIRAKDRGLVSRVLPEVTLDRRIHGANASANTGQSTQELLSLLRRRRAGDASAASTAEE